MQAIHSCPTELLTTDHGPLRTALDVCRRPRHTPRPRHGCQRKTTDGSMNARTTWGTVLLLAAAGCTSKDADHLARIGKQTVSRASTLTKTSDGQALGGWQLVR